MKRLSIVAYLVLILIGIFVCSGFQEVITGRRRASAGPPPTTVTYQSNCSGSAGGVTQSSCGAWAVTPSSGYQVVGVIWLHTGSTLTNICDGTGTNGCTGSSTYTILTAYTNSTNFQSYVFYTCNFQGTSTSITETWTTASDTYTSAVSASGGTTTGTNCNDGYNKNQSTSNGTAWTTSPNTLTTTNANDLMVGLFSNDCGVSTFTAGNDGQGHSYTAQVNSSHVVDIETLAETATNAYIATATAGSTCVWNAELLALK